LGVLSVFTTLEREIRTIVNQNTFLGRAGQPVPRSIASGFGLIVEVITRIENYSLIRYRGLKIIVNKEELQELLAMKRVA
jgi:hypothetical protein